MSDGLSVLVAAKPTVRKKLGCVLICRKEWCFDVEIRIPLVYCEMHIY